MRGRFHEDYARNASDIHEVRQTTFQWLDLVLFDTPGRQASVPLKAHSLI